MKCGYCGLTDGSCYPSDPPQVKCAITGEFRFFNAECDAFPKAYIIPVKHDIPCLICGETVRTVDTPINYPEVCDKCKAAVLKLRVKMEQEG